MSSVELIHIWSCPSQCRKPYCHSALTHSVFNLSNYSNCVKLDEVVSPQLQIVSSISPPGGLPGAGFVEVILQFSKGFISAESGAIIGVFEKVDDESFKRTRSFKADVNGTRIVSIALSPGEELLVCVLKNRQIILVPFQNSEFYKPDEVPKEATGHVSEYTHRL